MKKGFTLIELLAVLTVLGIIALISFPLVTKQINESKEKSYKNQVKTIINAAHRWAFDNDDLLPYEDTDFDSITVYLESIQASGYLQASEIIDPRTEEVMTGCIEITYDIEYSQHNYEYIKDCGVANY